MKKLILIIVALLLLISFVSFFGSRKSSAPAQEEVSPVATEMPVEPEITNELSVPEETLEPTAPPVVETTEPPVDETPDIVVTDEFEIVLEEDQAIGSL